MSPSRSEPVTTDPARPADHIDRGGDEERIASPTLGVAGWLRWAWRQLTSMRTALVLLLLLAMIAVPGSIFPQRVANPNGVTQFFRDNPDIAPTLDALQLFDLYGSVWFSSVYLLLFVSLIGCVIPRMRHHAKALRSRPPRTPVRLQRLDHHLVDDVHVPAHVEAVTEAPAAITIAERLLRRQGYRTERYDAAGVWSVSAERGYLRETGNLVFHASLVGVLVSVLITGGFAYTGQRVIVEGSTFVNSLSDYSSFTPGRFVDDTALDPYSLTLDRFDVTYELPGTPGAGQAGDFAARLTIRAPGDPDGRKDVVRVNHPIDVAGDRIYLLGNGYAPTITIRNAEGEVVYSESQPFLPQDGMMTSLGILKVPDGLPEQIGLVGFFYPTQGTLPSGAYTSVYPDLVNPVVTFNVFSGSLGIDDGTPRSVYTLDTSGMTQVTGGETGLESIELTPGQTANLPNGWGTITFEDAAGTGDLLSSVKRFVSLQIQRDGGAIWVLAFASIATTGLITALLVPRRRLWVKASLTAPDGAPQLLRLEYAGLARGEDPQLAQVVSRLREEHLAAVTDDPTDPPTDKETL
ncbi:cytochrome c biogenesis protein ResB [Microbacterium sediminis]|uniref:Cytochrome C biogenesis protein n=1 Tax=Microbacterium sediminis TaxID=904291 RepID=A0A1B9NHG1_9MICO|nr:cytochrome c biogenesis protein ResB [Microbacterium sediminis]OCG76038.1 cytochrome C biogenesis protein [Microbacterium sediminis]QBR73345.1 cytochrome c biogenesis protein ResB [Microbacterium sediminis]